MKKGRMKGQSRGNLALANLPVPGTPRLTAGCLNARSYTHASCMQQSIKKNRGFKFNMEENHVKIKTIKRRTVKR